MDERIKLYKSKKVIYQINFGTFHKGFFRGYNVKNQFCPTIYLVNYYLQQDMKYLDFPFNKNIFDKVYGHDPWTRFKRK